MIRPVALPMMDVSVRTVTVVAVLVFALLASLAFVATPDVEGEVNESVDDPGVDRVHADGVTGEGVTVAVLDPTGFDTGDDAYADQVAGARAFGASTSVGPGVGETHGTRSAREVVDVAPDVDLYLAGFDGDDGYGRAMAWAVRNDADVVVVPTAFHGKRGDGNATVEAVTERAAAHGVVVVAAAGNTARGHWQGRYRRVRGDALVVDEGIRNYLRGDSDVVRAWISWDREHADVDFTLELYRVTADGPRLVARSVPYEVDDVPNERLNVRVEGDTHFLVVRGPSRPLDAEVDVTTSTHALQHFTVRESIVAPATAEGVLAVGAWNPVQDRLAAYSASGPTADGRLGVDVVAPARAADGFRGSSVAAARTGGVAALVLEARPNATPADVESYVQSKARDVGRAGADPRTGHGRIRPERSVEAAFQDATANRSRNETGTADTNETGTVTNMRAGTGMRPRVEGSVTVDGFHSVESSATGFELALRARAAVTAGFASLALYADSS